MGAGLRRGFVGGEYLLPFGNGERGEGLVETLVAGGVDLAERAAEGFDGLGRVTVGGLRDDEAADGHGPSTRRSGGGGDDGVTDEGEQRFVGGGPGRGSGERGPSAGGQARPERGGAGVTLSDATSMPYNGYLGDDGDSLAILNAFLTDRGSGMDLPAAIIVETVQAEGGINVATREWLQGLEAICRKHQILLIVDDVQAGCGRTGAFFSFEDAGISPEQLARLAGHLRRSPCDKGPVRFLPERCDIA